MEWRAPHEFIDRYMGIPSNILAFHAKETLWIGARKIHSDRVRVVYAQVANSSNVQTF